MENLEIGEILGRTIPPAPADCSQRRVCTISAGLIKVFTTYVSPSHFEGVFADPDNSAGAEHNAYPREVIDEVVDRATRDVPSERCAKCVADCALAALRSPNMVESID